MSLKTTVTLAAKASTKQTIVLGIAKGKSKLILHAGQSGVDTTKLLPLFESIGAGSKLDQVTKLAQSDRIYVATGLGEDAKTFSAETLRRASGAAVRELAGTSDLALALPHDSIPELAAIAEGALLGNYQFSEFRSNSKHELKKPVSSFVILTKLEKDATAKKAVVRAKVIAEQSYFVRDLINTPPSHLTPDSFSTRSKKIASSLGLKVEILNAVALKAKGFGGISAVGQGSANTPRLLHISYEPAKAKRRFALVGKGITFDSGGLALKPAAGMEAMKSDMSGAAAVVGTIFAAAQLKLNVAIDAWAPLAENMISENATRPSDIITIYGGKTVEVLNPDAEGRLVLADAMMRAEEVGAKAGGLDGLIDVATLTGAQVVALGTRTSAVMTNNLDFSGQFLTAANTAGEAFWPMPLPEELRASLDSPVADIANIGERMGGMLVAGLFLREFVSPNTPWLHLDIAGPAYNEGAAHGYTPVGGTAIALRSLVTLLELASSQG
jgi:leucyl aminopeptidase